MSRPIGRYSNKTLIVNRSECSPVHCECHHCVGGPSCCEQFEILLTPQEAFRIEGYFKAISRYRLDIVVKGGYQNVFDKDEDTGMWVLEKDDQGWCSLEYEDAKGGRLCAIHAAALDLGLNPFDLKPLACSLWPLGILESEKFVQLGVDDDAGNFDCVKIIKDNSDSTELLALVKCFGAYFSKVRIQDE